MTDILTPPTTPHRRALTLDEYATEARRRFGNDPHDWAFTCPGCGHTATARDYPPGHEDRAGQDCIGRWHPERGCLRTANGYITGPWLIRLADGRIVGSFPLATPEARTAPLSASRETARTDGPEDASDALTAPWRPEADPETALPSQPYLTDNTEDQP